LQTSPEDEEAVNQLLQSLQSPRIIVINPIASELSHLRRWPAERFQQLIRELLQRDADAAVIIVGAPDEEPYVAELLRPFRNESRVTNFCGRLTFAQLPALFRRAHLMISNDGGPLHVAALVGCDTISIFGPETPALYGPVGPGRHQVLYRGIFCSP